MIEKSISEAPRSSIILSALFFYWSYSSIDLLESAEVYISPSPDLTTS
jgi:hypothetical protein